MDFASDGLINKTSEIYFRTLQVVWNAYEKPYEELLAFSVGNKGL